MRRLVPWLLLSWLAACSGAVVVNQEDDGSAYDPGMAQYAARDGTLPIELRGAPFSGDAGLDAAVPLPAWLGAVHPVVATPSAIAGYHIVLAFAGSEFSCALGRAAAGAPSGPVQVRAAFCGGARPIAVVTGHGPSAAGPDDPALRELMSEIMLTLLPPSAAGQPGGSSGGSAGM